MASANSMSHLDNGSLIFFEGSTEGERIPHLIHSLIGPNRPGGSLNFGSCRQGPFSSCCIVCPVVGQTFVKIFCSVSSFATGTFHVAGNSLILAIPSWFALVLKTLMHHVHDAIMLEESL